MFLALNLVFTKKQIWKTHKWNKSNKLTLKIELFTMKVLKKKLKRLMVTKKLNMGKIT